MLQTTMKTIESEGVENQGFELGGDAAITDITNQLQLACDQDDIRDRTPRDINPTVRRHHSEVPVPSTKRVHTDPFVIIEEDYDTNNENKLQRPSQKKTTHVARHHTEVLRKRTSVSNFSSVLEAGSSVATRRSLSRGRHSDGFLNKKANLISGSTRILQEFISKESDKHVNTRDFVSAKKVLEHKNLVLIAGRRGSGKTHLAMKLAKSTMAISNSLSPMFINDLNDLRILVESGSNTIVVVDDFLGNYRFMEEAADEVQVVWNSILYLIDRRKMYLIFTCDTMHLKLLSQAKNYSFFETFQSYESIIEMDEDKFHLTKGEKTKLVKTIGRRLHSSFKSSEMEELSSLHSQKYGFPLLCQLVALGASTEDLQEAPNKFMETHLNKIFNSEIKLYITLVVLLVFGGRLNVSKYKASERRILDKIAALLDVDEEILNDSTLKVVAETADDNHIIKANSSGKYKIGSKFLIECLTKHLIKKCGDDALGLLPLKVIAGFELRQSSMEENEQTEAAFCEYLITNHKYKYLVHRFKHILSTSEPDLLTMASCVTWEDDAFVDMALTIISVDNFLVEKENNQTLLAALSSSNKYSAIKCFLEFISEFRTDIIETKQDRIKQTMITACKNRSRMPIVQLLFKYCDINHDELICAAAESGDKSLIGFLVKKGVPFIDKKGKVPEVLSVYGHVDIIKKYIEESDSTSILNKRGHKGNTIFHSVVMCTNTNFVEYLMNKGADPEVVNREGFTVLHVASMYGRIDTVKLICARTQQILHHRDNNGFTATHLAAREGHLDVLKFLIEQNVPGKVVVAGSNTILHLAAYNGQTEVLIYLLKKYPDLIQAQNNESFTASQTAARMGHIDTLQACINAGIKPDSKTVDGRSFLHLSAFNGRLALVKHLCSHYPNLIEITDADGNTFAHDAAASGDVSVVKFVLQSYICMKSISKDGCTVLHDACYYGRLEVSRYLVEHCPDLLHMKTTSGYTPCHGAALGGFVELFRFLVSSGSDPLALSNDNSTALHEAAFNGKFEMVKYLSENYPELLVKRNKMEYTATHFASQEGHVEILSYLITLTKQPTIETRENQTLLHIAAYNNRFEAVKFLCQSYPSLVTRQDSTGATALHYAARGGNIEICNYLIRQVGDPVMKTNSGSTVLHLACHDGHLDLTKHLCENYPLLVNELDETGHNAAHYAAGSGSVELLEFVLSRGVDPMSRTTNGSTILLKAAYNGKKDVVEYICVRYPEIIRITDNFGCNLAHYAVCGGNIEVLLYGINGSIDPLSVTSDGHSLLHIAAVHGQIKIVKFLCENFPELRKTNDNAGLSPEHYAQEGQQERVIQYLSSFTRQPVSSKIMPDEDNPDRLIESKCQPFCDCLSTCLRCRCTKEYAVNVVLGIWRRIVGILCFFRRN